MIAKMPPDFAHHRRYCERDEIRALGRVESVDCLHQTDSSDLDQVVDGLATPAEMTGNVIGQY